MDGSRHSLFNEILGRLVRSMLHDLNSPLSSILGYSSKNISRMLDPKQDWDIVYEQGLKLSESIKFWQSMARLQIPQYDGNVVKVARYVFKAFKSSYASKIAVTWNDDCENADEIRIKADPEEHLYFWTFLFCYFMSLLSENEKGKLSLSFCDNENIMVNAEFTAESKSSNLLTETIMQNLGSILEDIVVERELSDNQLKFVLQKLPIEA